MIDDPREFVAALRALADPPLGGKPFPADALSAAATLLETQRGVIDEQRAAIEHLRENPTAMQLCWACRRDTFRARIIPMGGHIHPDFQYLTAHLAHGIDVQEISYDHAAATLTISARRAGRDPAGNVKLASRKVVLSVLGEGFPDRAAVALRELSAELNDPRNLLDDLPAELT